MPPSKATGISIRRGADFLRSQGTLLEEPLSASPLDQSRFVLWSGVILALLFIAIAVPLIALQFYSAPSSDDFCKATLSFNAVPQSGILSLTWHYYTQWSPRWLTTLLESLVMNKLNMVTWYGWLLLGVSLSNLAALWFFLSTVLRLTRGAALIGAALFYLAWVTNIASPGETIYWLTGAMEYQLSLSALLILISLLQKTRATAWYYLLLALLSVWIPAQHEIAGALVCSILLAGMIVRFAQHRDLRPWIFAFAMAAISFATVMLAPGMVARVAHNRAHGSDAVAILWCIKHAFLHRGPTWLVRPAILLAAVSIALLPKAKNQTGEKLLPGGLALAAVFGMGALLLEVAGVESSMGGSPPGRVIGWLQFGFWLLLVSAIVAKLPTLQNAVTRARVRVFCLLLLAVSLLASRTFHAAAMDVQGPAQAWRQSNLARLSPHAGSVDFTNLPDKPKLFIRQALSPDPTCWVNRCMASYIGATTVIVSGSGEACPR